MARAGRYFPPDQPLHVIQRGTPRTITGSIACRSRKYRRSMAAPSMRTR